MQGWQSFGDELPVMYTGMNLPGAQAVHLSLLANNL